MNRPGAVVSTDVGRMRLIDRAAPSGWWAIPVDGGRPVRIVLSRRRSDVASVFRVVAW